MGTQHIHATATTAADPARVYELLRDGETWPRWSPIDSFELERPGMDEREGVGAIRIFRSGRYTMREQIVELVPGRRFSYVLLSGLPVHDYRADVDVERVDEGAVISWRTSFAPTLPGTGWMIRRRLGRITERFVQGLARYAAEMQAAARRPSA